MACLLVVHMHFSSLSSLFGTFFVGFSFLASYLAVSFPHWFRKNSLYFSIPYSAWILLNVAHRRFLFGENALHHECMLQIKHNSQTHKNRFAHSIQFCVCSFSFAQWPHFIFRM